MDKPCINSYLYSSAASGRWVAKTYTAWLGSFCLLLFYALIAWRWWSEVMADHVANAMDRDLKSLINKIEAMGGIAQKMFASAIDAIIHADTELAQVTIAFDNELDALQRQIQEDAVLVIARRQPVGADLREILGATRISGELERIGDLSKNIAKRAISLSGTKLLPAKLTEFRNRAEIVASELRDVLDAFIRRDEWRAEAIWLRNTKSGSELDVIPNELIYSMIRNPRDIKTSTQLLFSSKNLEHIIGHTINIAEIVHYMVTGDLFPLEQRNLVGVSD